MRNGSSNNEPLSEATFENFIQKEWHPHTNKVDGTMRTLAESMRSIAITFNWAAKAVMCLLVILVLLNGSQTFINQLKDSGTSFVGKIGGANGAAIELHQKEKQ